MSDPHFFSPDLGTLGEAFEEYLNRDRKLIRESSEIFETAVHNIIQESPDFVLIPGDLTKDGEKINHEHVAALLHLLEQHNIRVYIIPGNHDIDNFEAYRYFGDSVEPVVSVTPAIFEKIYYDFGYGEAIARDTESLSYVVEPTPGLWIFGLDACRYDEHRPGKPPKIGGRFQKSTLPWIVKMLNRANQEQKAVIGFIHHGVLEHFEYQAEYFADYIVKDWRSISRMLAGNNMKIVFTGHFHAQDIAVRYFSDGKFIYDIETGSLVTCPCPWRMITITADQKMTVRTDHVESIPSYPDDFPEHAFQFLRSGIKSVFLQRTKMLPWLPAEARRTAGDFANLLIAHYQGDEPAGKRYMRIRGGAGCCLLGLTSEMIEGLESDPDPPDNNLIIDLRTGKFR